MPTLNTFPANPTAGDTYTIDSGAVYVCSSADPDIWNIQGTNATVLGTDQVTTDKIKDLAVTNDKLLGSISEAKIVSLPTTKLTGTIADSQIAAVATTKLTGTITNAQLASGISASKITGLSGGGGTLNGAGAIVAGGNRMVFSGTGAGGAGGSGGQFGGGGTGYYTNWAIAACTAGETVTVVVGTSATTYTGSTTGLIISLGKGVDGGFETNGAGGTLTGTVISSLAQGSATGAGDGSGQAGIFGAFGGSGASRGGSGSSGFSLIHTFFSI